jgi:hypothetical protein
MKSILIALLVLPASLLFSGSAFALPSSAHAALTDTTRKTLTAKETRQLKKTMKNVVPKEVSDMVLKTVSGGTVTDVEDMPSSMAKMSYAIERNELIREFKSDTFDSAKEKREAKKELKRELRELKKEYKQELKESKQELKESKQELKESKQEEKEMRAELRKSL